MKSRMFLMLPRMGIVRTADELKLMRALIPTYGHGEPSSDGRYTPCKLAVLFCAETSSEPLTPFCGLKNVAIPLFPAGQATSNLGPMIDKLLVSNGLVMIICEEEWQSE